ncbi:hypothetical protein G6L37_06260 [Agrobacterium rubi]|nr:hypothetical protein [Agrobacterium rubi]NTF24965.1 hypothetical protein [Agrobacterium rubi]
MPRPLRLLDSIIIVLAARLLAASYKRYGYAPIPTQFALVVACNLVGAVAGCYLVSRWTIPHTLTGLLILIGAASALQLTALPTELRRMWNKEMYDRSLVNSRLRYQTRTTERLLTLLSLIFCTTWAVMSGISGDLTGMSVFTGLACLTLSSSISGYLRAAPPPEPRDESIPG